MKQWKFNIWIILFACVFDPFATIGARADILTANQDKASIKDSLLVLDTLVIRYKISNNPLAVQYAKRALVIARLMNSDEAFVIAYKALGTAYSQNQKDSSLIYFNAALKIAEDAHLLKQKVHIIYNLAMLYKAASNYKLAIILLDSSIRLAESVKNYTVISNAYNTIGNIKDDMHDYASARNMYDTALKVATSQLLYKQMGVATSNLAVGEKNSVKSISMLKKALNYLNKTNGVEEQKANVLINIGNRYPNNPDSALFYYKSALDLAINANLPKILMGAYNSMAYCYLDKGFIQMAESCIKDHAIPVAIKNKDHDWLSSLYDTYADVCFAQKDYKKAYEMQDKALSERIADNKQKASDQVRLLAALLDTKNQELIIQDEKSRLQRTKLWLIITILLVAASVFIIFGLRQRHRVKLQKEQTGSARRIIEMEESEKGRTARELHDLTGQLVMGISGAIENAEFPDPLVKEHIKERIKELGSSIRQISHRMNRAMIEHFTFSELITGLCKDVQKLSGMSVQLEMPETFPDLPNEMVLHFYRITQELLTNATKYARNSQVKIRIIFENGKLTLLYSDNGPGFLSEEKKKSSMGIMNIFERTKLINGQAFVKSSPGKGTSWEIFFPVDVKKVVKLKTPS